jgi:hypothetical protein
MCERNLRGTRLKINVSSYKETTRQESERDKGHRLVTAARYHHCAMYTTDQEQELKAFLRFCSYKNIHSIYLYNWVVSLVCHVSSHNV